VKSVLGSAPLTLVDVLNLVERPIPIIAAPMAGAGGLGFLAAGYRDAEQVAQAVRQTRELTDQPFGVNVFVPDSANVAASALRSSQPSSQDEAADRAALEAYREELKDDAERLGVRLPPTDPSATDHWQAKLDLLTADPVAAVSFTFGLPEQAVIRALQAVGSLVVLSVSDPAEALAAARQGADALVVQGPAAGGHRATHLVRAAPNDTDLLTLLAEVRAVTRLPLIAAGGLTRPAQIAAALSAGAGQVQLGTVFLRSTESGVSDAYKAALAAPEFATTTTTRAFSGRVARGLVNRFITRHDAAAPARYPEVVQLTGPLRAAAAAAGDLHGVPLWAGTGFRDATAEPAADIVARLWAETQALLST
jgi:nitronate monooxygenase